MSWKGLVTYIRWVQCLGDHQRRCSLPVNQYNMEENQMTEKILTLTLEIICLLTEQDYTVVKKKSGECVTPDNYPCVSRGWSRTQSPIMRPPPKSLIHERNKKLKILELTHKIIELLTEEVSIRCQDVTVYFSMEEWEYIEEHKCLYKDVMIENQLNLTSPGSANEYSAMWIKEEPVLCDGGNLTDPDIYTPIDNTQHHPSTRIKEKTAVCAGGNIEDPNIYSPTGHTQLYSSTHIKEHLQQEKCTTDAVIYTCTDHTPQYPSADIKEETTSLEKGQFIDPDLNTLTDHIQHPRTYIKEESVVCDGGNATTINIYTSDCRDQYSSAPSIKEEVTCERINLSGPITYTSSDHSEQYLPTHVLEEPVLRDGENLTDPNMYSSTAQLVSLEGENLHNNFRYIFKEHTYTHLNKNKFSQNAENFVEDLMDSLPHVAGSSSSMEGFSTEVGLAELQYISNHIRSPDWCPAKANRHKLFLSKCVEYEKHFCKVSRARICGTHLTEWTFNCSECQNCLNATLKRIRQNLKHQEINEKSVKTSRFAERQTKKKEFACVNCGKHFPNKRYLLTHRRVHSEENPFHCPACDQSFEDQEGFAGHQKNPDCERPFSCSECGKRFKSRYNSEYHKKIHTENKKYLCPVCGKSFRKQSCFLVHERTHTGEKPYACPECGRCFSQNASLISHQRLHTGEKPFTCLECGRNFTQRISLVVHQRVHSGDRPYKCQECGKGFTQRIGLVQHQRRHTGEKPFTCSECGKSFTLHDSLVKHLRTHTGEKPYICSDCGKRFCQSSQLTAHKRFHHATQHSTRGTV